MILKFNSYTLDIAHNAHVDAVTDDGDSIKLELFISMVLRMEFLDGLNEAFMVQIGSWLEYFHELELF
jgi:hypothetical protein